MCPTPSRHVVVCSIPAPSPRSRPATASIKPHHLSVLRRTAAHGHHPIPRIDIRSSPPFPGRRSSAAAGHHGAAVSVPARVVARSHDGGRRVGGLVALREIQHGRHRPHQLRRVRPAGGDAQPRPQLRRWLQLQGGVPLRRVHHPDEAHPRQLRRHRLLLLPFFRRRRRARRDRHGVHGQLERPARGAQHQRVGQRRRQEGAPVRPVVRPGRRLPHLHHNLEPDQHHVQGGRQRDPLLQALRRPPLPELQAHDAARHAVGRQLLGHREGQGPHRLVRRALRRLLPGILRRRLRQRWRLRRRQRRVDEQAARQRRVGHRQEGREQLHALQLLRRRLEVPAGAPGGVQPQLILDSLAAVLLHYCKLLLIYFCWIYISMILVRF